MLDGVNAIHLSLRFGKGALSTIIAHLKARGGCSNILEQLIVAQVSKNFLKRSPLHLASMNLNCSGLT